jgi:tetratricopeptide (TPR) repeat protein
MSGPSGNTAEVLDRIRKRRADGDSAAAHQLLDDHEAAIRADGASDDDPRFAPGCVERAKVYKLEFRFDEAYASSERAEALARRGDDPAVLADALALFATAARRRGDLIQASALAEEAQDLFDDLGDDEGVARSTWARATVARQRGELATAVALYEGTQKIYERIGDRDGLASCLYGLGRIQQLSKNDSEAKAMLERARDIFDELGNQRALANTFNVLAESARFRGDLDEAETGYRRALSLHEAIGSSDALISRVNLGLVLLSRSEYAQARGQFEDVFAALAESDGSWLDAAVHVAILPCCAEAGDWDAWDRHVAKATELLAESGAVDPDIAFPAEMAAKMAHLAGETERAERAAAISLAQRKRLGA